jgi:hypothetical protein
MLENDMMGLFDIFFCMRGTLLKNQATGYLTFLCT